MAVGESLGLRDGWQGGVSQDPSPQQHLHRGFPDVVAGVQCNLPGWRWATITKVALDRLSRSLHSDVCDSDGLRDAAIHSTISGSGGRRDRAASYILR